MGATCSCTTTTSSATLESDVDGGDDAGDAFDFEGSAEQQQLQESLHRDIMMFTSLAALSHSATPCEPVNPPPPLPSTVEDVAESPSRESIATIHASSVTPSSLNRRQSNAGLHTSSGSVMVQTRFDSLVLVTSQHNSPRDAAAASNPIASPPQGPTPSNLETTPYGDGTSPSPRQQPEAPALNTMNSPRTLSLASLASAPPRNNASTALLGLSGAYRRASATRNGSSATMRSRPLLPVPTRSTTGADSLDDDSPDYLVTEWLREVTLEVPGAVTPPPALHSPAS